MEPGPNTNRRNWLLGGLLIFVGALFLLWQLIPARVMGALVPMTILGGIGVTFLAVYLNDRNHWWALIPSYIMFAVAGIIFLSDLLRVGELVAPYVMFAIALPFLYVFVRNREHWWALIPAGIMGSIGVALLVGMTARFFVPAIPVVMIIAGLYLLMRNRGDAKKRVAPPTTVERAPIEYEPIRQISGPEADKTRN